MSKAYWRNAVINDICDSMFSGGTPNTSEPLYWDGSYSWLSSGETRNDFIHKTEKKITEEGVKKSSTRLALKNDIVMASAGQGKTRGQTSILKIDSYINQSIIAIRPNNKMYYKFLYYVLKSRYEELRTSSDASSIRGSITTQDLKIFKIKYPEYKEQIKISKILFSYDNLIENNNRRIAILEEMAQRLYREWFVHFRFPGHESVNMVESELGLMPEGWEVLPLGEVVNNFDSKRKPISTMRRMDMQGDYPYYGAAKIIDYVNDYIFDGTYLLVAEDGSVITTDKKPVLQYVDGKMWVNNHTHILQGKNISTEYLYLALSRLDISGYITGAAQPKITQENLNRIPLIIPTNDIKEQFDNLSKKIYSEIIILQNKNTNLRKTRDLLLPHLISGDIDVSELPIPIEED